MNKCRHCTKDTLNPSFCSRSCAAKETNKIPKRKRRIWHCILCNVEILPKRKFCLNCNKNHVDWSEVKLQDVIDKRKYQVHSRIRDLARKAYRKSNKPKKCIMCNYSKHYEVAHIKPIHSFPETSYVSEINHLDNLTALCPNCHWEFDEGLIDI